MVVDFMTPLHPGLTFLDFLACLLAAYWDTSGTISHTNGHAPNAPHLWARQASHPTASSCQ